MLEYRSRLGDWISPVATDELIDCYCPECRYIVGELPPHYPVPAIRSDYWLTHVVVRYLIENKLTACPYI